MMKSVIVVPTYNEAENMPLLAEQIIQHLPNAHVIVMDDNSPDRTANICESLFQNRTEYRNYRVVRRSGPRGLGRAYREGFQRALSGDYDRIIQMDADLSHDSARLPELLSEADCSDLVIGSRYCPGGGVQNWPVRRIWLSKFACWYVKAIARVPVKDATGGYRCWTRRALEAVQLETLRSEGYSFQVEMLHRASQAGMKISEIPIIFTDRQFGKSKISRTVLLESFVMPWKLRFSPWRPDEAAVHAFATNQSSTK